MSTRIDPKILALPRSEIYGEALQNLLVLLRSSEPPSKAVYLFTNAFMEEYKKGRLIEYDREGDAEEIAWAEKPKYEEFKKEAIRTIPGLNRHDLPDPKSVYFVLRSRLRKVLDKKSSRSLIAHKVASRTLTSEKRVGGPVLDRLLHKDIPQGVGWVTDPAPHVFLRGIGKKMGLEVREAYDYTAIFDIESPVIAFLELHMISDGSSKHRNGVEISYLTPNGQKVSYNTYFFKNDLVWLDGQKMWSIKGADDRRSLIRKAQGKAEKDLQKIIAKLLKQMEISNTDDKTELALKINEKLGIGIDPNALYRLMNVLTVWEEN